VLEHTVGSRCSLMPAVGSHNIQGVPACGLSRDAIARRSTIGYTSKRVGRAPAAVLCSSSVKPQTLKGKALRVTLLTV
jgi:hypothetical protein